MCAERWAVWRGGAWRALGECGLVRDGRALTAGALQRAQRPARRRHHCVRRRHWCVRGARAVRACVGVCACLYHLPALLPPAMRFAGQCPRSGSTIVFTETKKEANELVLHDAIKQGPHRRTDELCRCALLCCDVLSGAVLCCAAAVPNGPWMWVRRVPGPARRHCAEPA